MSDGRRARHSDSDAELAELSREELVELGGRIDGVETVFKEPRWPVEGTKAEKRAERAVAYWLLLGGVSGLALLVIFLFWPWEYKPFGSEGEWLYVLATPLYGLTFGLSILAIGIGAVLYQKKFIPEEISIQDRHDGASAEIHRKTIAANLTETLDGFDHQAPQADRAFARRRPRRLRTRHGRRLRRRAHQEPVGQGRPDGERQGRGAVHVGVDPALPRRDHLHGPRHWAAGRITLRQDAARGHRRGRHGDGVPVARVRRRRHHRRVVATSSPRSRWACATR